MACELAPLHPLACVFPSADPGLSQAMPLLLFLGEAEKVSLCITDRTSPAIGYLWPDIEQGEI